MKHSEQTKLKISLSKKGSMSWNKGIINSGFKRGYIPWNKGLIGYNLGRINSEETRRKMSETQKGRPKWTKEQKENLRLKNIGKTISQSTREKISKFQKGKVISEETRKKIADANRGSKSHFWRGGITPINKAIRNGIEFRLWRESVFKRDNFTCQICNLRGGELHPHHIKPFALFPELRFAIDNGMTLCAQCHRETDTWGLRINKK